MTKFILKIKTSFEVYIIRDTSMYNYNNNYSKNKQKDGRTVVLQIKIDTWGE